MKTLFVVALLMSACTQSEPQKIEHMGKESENPKGQFFHEVITGDTPQSSRQAWDRFFDTEKYVFGKDPTPFLSKNIESLIKNKKTGKALVLAMGEGRDAVFLAKAGFEVDGVDISGVAIRKAARLARENGVKINAINANLKYYKIQKDAYDVIVNVTYFRSGLIPSIKDGLREGGYVVFQNYLTDHIKNPGGTGVPNRFLVERGELKRHFSDFQVVEYLEGNDGTNALASLIARKK